MALFLLSYLVVMLLPLSIGIIYYYPNMRQMLIDQAKDQNVRAVAQLNTEMDSQLANVYGMPGYIFSNKYIIEYDLRTSQLARKDAQNQLSLMIQTNTFIDQLFLYLRNDGYLIGTRAGSFYYDELTENPSLYQISFGSVSNEELRYYLDTTNEPLVLPARGVSISGNRHGHSLLFVLPVPQGNLSYGTAVICIPADNLKSLISADRLAQDSAFLFFEQGRLIYSTQNIEDAAVEAIETVLRDHGTSVGAAEIDLNGSRHLLTWDSSSKYAWSYAHIVPLRAVTQEADHLQRVNLMITLGIALLGTLLIFIAMRINYAPLQKLARIQGPSTNPKNDFEAIHALIQSLQVHNEHLGARIHQTEPQLREYLVKQCLQGAVADAGAFLHQCAQVGILLQKAPYQVLCVVYAAEEPMLDALARLNEQELSGDAEVTTSHDEKDNALVLIRSGAMEKQDWETIVQNLGCYDMAGVGTEVASVFEVSESYRHADAVLDYLHLNSGHGQMLRYEDLPERVFKPRGYPTEVMQALEMGIQHNDTEKVRKLTEQISSLLLLEGAPPYYTRSVYFNATNLLIAGLQRFMGSQNEIVHEIGTRSMLNHYTAQEMSEILHNTAAQLIRLMGQVHPPQSSIAQVLNYIDQHLDSSALSLQSVADVFSLTASTLSRLFKEKTTRNFKEYVDSARVAQAKELLRNGNMPVEQIALAVGYDNVTSFYRLFKKYVGVAPGEYRQVKKAQMPRLDKK